MVFIAQLGVIAIMLLGENIFAAVGVPVPVWYDQWKDKKMAIIMATWFLGTMFRNSLISTGAFEVFYDGHQVGATVLLASALCNYQMGPARRPLASPLALLAFHLHLVSAHAGAHVQRSDYPKGRFTGKPPSRACNGS